MVATQCVRFEAQQNPVCVGAGFVIDVGAIVELAEPLGNTATLGDKFFPNFIQLAEHGVHQGLIAGDLGIGKAAAADG